MTKRFVFYGLIVVLFGVWIAARTSPLDLPLNSIKLPDGFQISIFASNVRNARSMTLGSNGTVFVGTKDAGNVYALVDRQVITIAHGLNMPNGVAFHDGALY